MRSALQYVSIALFAVHMLAVVGCKDQTPAPAATTATPASSTPAPAAAAAAAVEKCEHGVQKDICTRCNPALAVAFKAKNDWCDEHNRAESQCVECHPELAQKGIK